MTAVKNLSRMADSLSPLAPGFDSAPRGTLIAEMRGIV
jgi:hypothetical protein